MTPRVDEIGNIIGHYSARDEAKSEAKSAVWLFGSHLDTVPDAGKYDGMLGVLLAIEMVAALEGEKLPFAVEVVGFSEEEGVRFKTPYLGSRALVGTFEAQWLELRDPNGISLRDALRDFGLHPENWRRARHHSPLLGYFEAHIEQGPVLESLGAPLGIVSAIAGQSRLQLRFAGEAGHAGTLPMNARRDALAAASEWILAVETMGNSVAGLVATVGALQVGPNAPNVVPGEVICSLDVRHASDPIRENAVGELLKAARDLVLRRGGAFEVLARADHPAVAMDETLRAALKSACGAETPAIVSGAGHDAAIMAAICPTAMLFLRTPGGASHCPAETVTTADVALALGAMGRFFSEISNSGATFGSETF